MDVLCIGTAVVDIAAYPIENTEKWQEKQRIQEISMTMGGDAANQSVRLADMGRRVHLCASLGKDANGTLLRSLLKERNVCTDLMAVREDYGTGTALVLINKNGDRNVFSVKGAHSMLEKEDLPDLSKMSCQRPSMISVGSLFSLPILEKDGLLEYLIQAKTYGIQIAADLGSDKLHQGLEGIRVFLPYLDYFLPSDYDAMQMTGASSVEEAAEVYRHCGCRNVVIKCGEKGCWYQSEQERGWVPAVKVKPLDTNGAGDSMVAFFIHRILCGDSLKDACKFACAGASLGTLYSGASVHKMTEADILEWKKKGVQKEV
ncbi:MAG: carbohydrate kinase family protein [Muricoprocola sp.]